jgi:thymidine kinase
MQHVLHDTDGRIELILGPMFAGKSSEMLRRIRRYKLAKHRVLLLKYAKDTRYSDTAVATHDGVTVEAVSACNFEGVDVENFDVIGIDEGQFFPDLGDFVERAASAGKIVVISALDGDFQRKPFQNICDLVPRSEFVIKLSAVCTRCSHDAAFTMRTSADTEVEVIGGAELYQPVCRRCYMEHSVMSPLKGRTAARAQGKSQLRVATPESEDDASTSSSPGLATKASTVSVQATTPGTMTATRETAVVTPVLSSSQQAVLERTAGERTAVSVGMKRTAAALSDTAEETPAKRHAPPVMA